MSVRNVFESVARLVEPGWNCQLVCQLLHCEASELPESLATDSGDRVGDAPIVVIDSGLLLALDKGRYDRVFGKIAPWRSWYIAAPSDALRDLKHRTYRWDELIGASPQSPIVPALLLADLRKSEAPFLIGAHDEIASGDSLRLEWYQGVS